MEINVKITKFQDRKFWLMYYDDPLSGKRITRSTKESKEREARKAAGKWESELSEGRFKPKSKITWGEFRDLFTEHVLSMSDNAQNSYVTSLNAVERHLSVERLLQLTSVRIDFLKRALLEEKLSTETVRSYLRHLRAALNWAKRKDLLAEVPAFEMPKRVKGEKMMKGRPIVAEEFERMLAKVEAGLVLANTSRVNKHRKRRPTQQTAENRNQRLVDGAKAAAPGWARFLRGLWWSGLRLGEAINLSWDDERHITVDLSKPDKPMLRIASGQDKSGKARTLPLAPEFREMLLATPKDQRTGPVFPLRGLKGEPTADGIYISKVVSAIGEAAKVVVDKASGKFASAHDLRRSFGVRWSTRVMPAVLKELMRHADVGTTMKYYAGQDAATIQDAVDSAFAGINTSVNSGRPVVQQQDFSDAASSIPSKT